MNPPSARRLLTITEHLWTSGSANPSEGVRETSWSSQATWCSAVCLQAQTISSLRQEPCTACGPRTLRYLEHSGPSVHGLELNWPEAGQAGFVTQQSDDKNEIRESKRLIRSHSAKCRPGARDAHSSFPKVTLLCLVTRFPSCLAVALMPVPLSILL